MRYHSFFENTCNGVLIYEYIPGSDDYIIKDVNRVTAALLRMPKEELVENTSSRSSPICPTPRSATSSAGSSPQSSRSLLLP